jgi:uncharacterized membrane protein SpoIIM required for sporulation
MTKKILGISLIIIGGAIFLLTSISLVNNLTTSKKEMMEQVKTELATKGTKSHYDDENLSMILNESNQYGRMFLSIILLIGLGIGFGGFVLFKRSNKYNKLSGTFNFD